MVVHIATAAQQRLAVGALAFDAPGAKGSRYCRVLAATVGELEVEVAGQPMRLPWAAWSRVDAPLLVGLGDAVLPADDVAARIVLAALADDARLPKVGDGILDRAAVAAGDPALVKTITEAQEARRARSGGAKRDPLPVKAKEPRKPSAVIVSPASAAVLKVLGRDHVMFGLGEQPRSTWMAETREQGARWDLRYQYLCGDLNGSDWFHWDPNGAFATSYMNESVRLGTVPVFSLYGLVQSGRGGSEGDRAAEAVRNPGTMRRYYDRMQFLCAAAAKSGKPLILHLEPDLWGFAMQGPAAGFVAGPLSAKPAAVASSGHPDLAGLPDTMQGFCQALRKLRDTYGSGQTLLAFHPSQWGGVDAVIQAANDGGPWDLLFLDCSDRDAGWKLAHNYMAAGAWWKEGDFTAFRNTCARIHQGTRGTPLMLWQVPVGNTIMAACNDTEGHFQDNRAQHLLEGHPANGVIRLWAEAGVIAWMFGGGAAGCTSVGDGCKDGVTNPTPVAGNAGEQSKWPDDDGGYLRTRIAAYYKSPVPLTAPAAKR